MPEPIRELRFRFKAPRPAPTNKPTAAWITAVGPALPRITRLMALAIKLESLLQQYPDLDGLQLARHAHVSRSRITQILNLLCLAPDIQEHLLGLQPLAKGHEVITEKSLRRLAAEYHWERQRERFTQLLARRPGLFHTAASEQAACLAAPIHQSESPIRKIGSKLR